MRRPGAHATQSLAPLVSTRCRPTLSIASFVSSGGPPSPANKGRGQTRLCPACSAARVLVGRQQWALLSYFCGKEMLLGAQADGPSLPASTLKRPLSARNRLNGVATFWLGFEIIFLAGDMVIPGGEHGHELACCAAQSCATRHPKVLMQFASCLRSTGVSCPLLVLTHVAAVAAQPQAERAPGVVPLESAECPNDRWRDSCGICGGDGGSCMGIAVVFLALCALLIISIGAIWFKLLSQQVSMDKYIKELERGENTLGRFGDLDEEDG
jgi:hypothetical protein